MKKVAVLTAPRSGTHFLVRSVSNSLGIPYYIPYLLENHYPTESSWVIGSHSDYSKELEEKLIHDNVLRIVIKRDPLDRAISCLAFTQFDVLPNHQNFFDHHLMVVLNRQSKEELEWSKNANLVVNYETLIDNNSPNYLIEHSYLENLLETPFNPESLEKTSTRVTQYSQGSYAQPGAWKKVFTYDSIKTLCNKLGLPAEQYLNEEAYPTEEEGNSFFLKNYERSLKAEKDPRFGPPPVEPPTLLPPVSS